MKAALLIIIALVLLGFLAGCNYDNPASPDSGIQSLDNTVQTNNPETLIDPDLRPLLRSNNARIGTVNIYNTQDSIYVKFVMAQGYRLTKIKMHASLGVWSFPLTSNCPNLAAFRFQINSLPANTTSYIHKFPIATLGTYSRNMFGAIYVETETLANEPDCITAWAAGPKFPGCSGEGMHFMHQVQYIQQPKE